jgi:hypothetical protein
MPKHRDLNLIQKDANEDHIFLRSSPIMTLSLFAQMSYDIWVLKKEDNKPYEFQGEKTIPSRGIVTF